jgi:lipopolysaccharide export system permease protein
MYWRIAYVPGGQPIGALETFAANLGKWLRTGLRRFSPGRSGRASTGQASSGQAS